MDFQHAVAASAARYSPVQEICSEVAMCDGVVVMGAEWC